MALGLRPAVLVIRIWINWISRICFSSWRGKEKKKSARSTSQVCLGFMASDVGMAHLRLTVRAKVQ